MKKMLLFLCALLPTLIMADAPKTWCIVGGNRGAGNAIATLICNTPSTRCRLFTRDAAKTAALFTHCLNQPEIVNGDVTTDLEGLINAATNASYLVIAGAFPYNIWAKSFEAMILNCIAAAQKTGSTLIYYGRILRYGLVNPIKEDSAAAPCSEQGKVMNAMETILENCGLPLIMIPHSYPFGPRVGDGLLEKNFSEVPKNKGKKWFQSTQKFEWIGKQIPSQFTFVDDLARFTVQVTELVEKNPALLPCFKIQFPGLTLSSIDELGSLYCEIAQVPYEPSFYTKLGLTLAAAVRPDAKRATDAFYSFEQPILLYDQADSKQKLLCPFELTPLRKALHITFDAYAAE